MQNLFGEEVTSVVATKASNKDNWFKGTKHGNPCIKLFGTGPKDATCKTCQHLCRTVYDKSYIKCRLRGVQGKASSDHLAKWPTCAKYELAVKPPMVKPSMQEIANFFKLKGSTVLMATAFLERYEANGWTVIESASEKNHWRVGRKPMTDWQKAAKSFITKQENSFKSKFTKRY